MTAASLWFSGNLNPLANSGVRNRLISMVACALNPGKSFFKLWLSACTNAGIMCMAFLVGIAIFSRNLNYVESQPFSPNGFWTPIVYSCEAVFWIEIYLSRRWTKNTVYLYCCSDKTYWAVVPLPRPRKTWVASERSGWHKVFATAQN